MRPRSDTDFTVPVEGVGTFTFGRRKFSDEVKIQVEYARLLDGAEPTEWLHAVLTWLSALKILMVSAPESWNVEELDPHDNESYKLLGKVHGALRDQEDTFRRAKKSGN